MEGIKKLFKKQNDYDEEFSKAVTHGYMNDFLCEDYIKDYSDCEKRLELNPKKGHKLCFPHLEKYKACMVHLNQQKLREKQSEFLRELEKNPIIVKKPNEAFEAEMKKDLKEAEKKVKESTQKADNINKKKAFRI